MTRCPRDRCRTDLWPITGVLSRPCPVLRMGESADPQHGAESAVRDLVARYCMSIDDGRFDDFEGLWVSDAQMHVMGTTHQGPAAIRRFMEEAQPSERRGRHSIASHLMDIDAGAGTGRGWVDYVFFDTAGAATSIGRYHDLYARDVEGRWRFALREIVFQGAQPELTDRW